MGKIFANYASDMEFMPRKIKNCNSVILKIRQPNLKYEPKVGISAI